MIDAVFDQSYRATSRLAAVRAARIVALYNLPQNSRPDLEQEALLELWRKRTAYDPRRGSWRTFAERVVANRMVSLMRSMQSEKAGHLREEPLESALYVPAPMDRADIRIDIRGVLERMSSFDRRVALSLIDHSAVEASQKLGVSRATLYRSIKRLRAAFAVAGFGSGVRRQEKGR